MNAGKMKAASWQENIGSGLRNGGLARILFLKKSW